MDIVVLSDRKSSPAVPGNRPRNKLWCKAAVLLELAVERMLDNGATVCTLSTRRLTSALSTVLQALRIVLLCQVMSLGCILISRFVSYGMYNA